MNENTKEYKKRLEKEICEYMCSPVSERSAEAIYKMIKCWNKVQEFGKTEDQSKDMEYNDFEQWNYHMKNADGTTGGHWTIDQTSAVAEGIGIKFDHISEECWNVTMNMMYSDYYNVALKYGVSTANFYADMAKAFLFDEDGGPPKEKLYAYYESIVKTNMK